MTKYTQSYYHPPYRSLKPNKSYLRYVLVRIGIMYYEDWLDNKLISRQEEALSGCKLLCRT